MHLRESFALPQIQWAHLERVQPTLMLLEALLAPADGAPRPCWRLQMRTLDPATHAYSFWEGVPVDARCAFARLFAASATLRGIAVVQRAMRGGAPEDFMEDLGFGALRLVDSFAVTMSGGAQLS